MINSKTELQKKLQRIKELNDAIQFHKGQLLSREQKASIQEQQDRLEFRLKQKGEEFQKDIGKITQEYALQEADLKIESFEKVVNVLK